MLQDKVIGNTLSFEAGRAVCENGFSFELPIFIYGAQVEDYEIEIFEETYRIRGVDYEQKMILIT